MPEEELVERILTEKRKRNAVILAHNYQRPEVQDIGGYVGDSLGLARQALRVHRGTRRQRDGPLGNRTVDG